MRPYGNLSGDSGVVAYEVRSAAIVVRFLDGSLYEYTRESAGATALTEMLRLAQSGRGLSTFIAQHHPAYARKLG